MKALASLGAWLALVTLVPGCGKTSSASSSPTESGVTRENFASRTAEVICESFSTCCQRIGVSADVGKCRTQLTQELESELAADESPSSQFNAPGAADCLAAISAAKCGAFDDKGACDRIFVGTLNAGEPCQDDNDCKAPAGSFPYCSVGPNGNPALDQAVCVVDESPSLARGKLGDDCFTSCDGQDCAATPAPAPGDPKPVSTDVTCNREDGLYCDASFTCQKLKPVGKSCGSDEECAAGLLCDRAEGQCAAPKANGESCERDVECGGGDCADGKCRDLTPSAELCASDVPFK